MNFYPRMSKKHEIFHSLLSDLIRSFVPVGGDLLHDELHHLPGVAPSRADKTPEASAVFQQHAAAFSQHLVRTIQIVACLYLTLLMGRRIRAATFQFPLNIKEIRFRWWCNTDRCSLLYELYISSSWWEKKSFGFHTLLRQTKTYMFTAVIWKHDRIYTQALYVLCVNVIVCCFCTFLCLYIRAMRRLTTSAYLQIEKHCFCFVFAAKAAQTDSHRSQLFIQKCQIVCFSEVSKIKTQGESIVAHI